MIIYQDPVKWPKNMSPELKVSVFSSSVCPIIIIGVALKLDVSNSKS